ncbi:DUF6115 domain-containing protein [Butyrivibrio sp. WCE2006]|uniref:DUF6115 domain-containing protein n=1 Tax=Butyrivibrio sp. WCE2006 TaxID=1410611 RepID=UPI0006790BD4|nr:DUF6115 domain-containing protein [Butyrivibrio sp. WCE2006]
MISVTEIILIAAGILAVILGYLIPNGKDSSGFDFDGANQRINDMVSKAIKNSQSQIDDMLDDCMEEAISKAERAMDRVTNEKMSAISEYSDTVMNDIHKNHDEVVFMYDMLNDKHKNLKNTVSEANRAAKEVKEAEAKRQAEIEAEAKRKAELEAEAKKQAKLREEEMKKAKREAEARRLAELEEEAKRKALIEAEARRKAKLEAEAKRQAELEAEAKRKAELEAEAKRQAELEAQAKRRAELEAEEQRLAEIEAENQRQAELEAQARRQAVLETKAKQLSGYAADTFVNDEYDNNAGNMAVITPEKNIQGTQEERFYDSGASSPFADEPHFSSLSDILDRADAAAAAKTNNRVIGTDTAMNNAEDDGYYYDDYLDEDEYNNIEVPAKVVSISDAPRKKAEVVEETKAKDSVSDPVSRNQKILDMHKAGKSAVVIARELRLGIGEVKLVIDLAGKHKKSRTSIM